MSKEAVLYDGRAIRYEYREFHDSRIRLYPTADETDFAEVSATDLKYFRRCQAKRLSRIANGEALLVEIPIPIPQLSPCTSTTSMVVLRNGFSIRHERREFWYAGDHPIARLYLGSGPNDYIDIPLEDVDYFDTCTGKWTR